MAKNLIIVESPAKAKTLKKFLGSSYKVEASVGHVRDLPKSELGIDLENDFEPKYITIRGKGAILSKLRKEVKATDKVYLATDPDREGEAISWHLIHALKLDGQKIFRITFNEVTKNAVKRSIKEARNINMGLVDAQQARRALDRIVGYKLSPLLWKKVKKGLSAGRVQSVALRIICDREDEIENFTPEEYWTIDAVLDLGKEELKAHLVQDDLNNKVTINNKDAADAIIEKIKDASYVVKEVKKGLRTRKPIPPFTTSTLQQEASKILGFTTNKTMMLAQQLYEGVDIKGLGTIGLLTYIRTDSMNISDEAFENVKAFIIDNYGEDYASRIKSTHKAKGRAQEAHEAIRPTSAERKPENLKDSLARDQYKLYKLIWERFVASQMTPAKYDTLSVKISANGYIFRTSGSVLKFDGFLKVYSRNDDNAEEEITIPVISAGQELKLKKTEDVQHFTQAPPRYTDASLVKTLEELDIGRPSTYSAIITNIVQRGYISRENKIFYSTALGEIVNNIMKSNFENIVDFDFTAKMEEDLDKIEEGALEWKEILRQFYKQFDEKLKIAEEQIGQIEVEDEKSDILCENCGKNMVIKIGKFGKFLACPGFPECRNTKPFFESAGVNCPVCDGNILIKKTKKGRKFFGCDNAECNFMSWSRPTGGNCPVCGKFLIEKGTKKQKVICSDNECIYSEDKSNDDVD